jgi:GT2 family glycosyltransferase
MVSVIIANYNRKNLLRDCLLFLKSQVYSPLEIIVVDNASCDDSQEMIKKEFPEVKLIQNKTPLFFAKAYNKGIKESNAEYILVINNDVTLDKNFIKNAIEGFKLNPKIGSVCGKILRREGKFIDSTGQFLSSTRRARERGYRKRDYGQYDYDNYVFGAPGACALYKKEMLDDVRDCHGYFDERFKAYLEDLDLNWRAYKKGWLCYYTHSAIAYHRRGSTGWLTKKFPLGFLNLSLRFKLLYYLNRYRTIVKNDSFAYFLGNSPLIFVYDCYLLLGIVFHMHLNIIVLLNDLIKIIIKMISAIK